MRATSPAAHPRPAFEPADMVDEAVAEVADGRVPWTRFEQILDGPIVASDPAAAADRERAERSSGYARRTRSTDSGMAGFQIRAPVVALLAARVAWFAEVFKVLGDDRALGERRMTAVALLADPPAALELMRRFQKWRQRPEDPPMPAPDDPGDPGEADGQTGSRRTAGGMSNSRSRGIYVWRDPSGRFFLVDHTGARRVPSLRGLDGQPNVSRVEWRTNELIVDYDRIA